MLFVCYLYVSITVCLIYDCFLFFICRTAFVILSVALVAYNIQTDESSESDVNETQILLSLPLTSFIQIPTYLNNSAWQNALDEGKMWFMEEETIKRDLPPLKIDTPSYKHQKIFSSSPKALKLSTTGFINEFASRYTRGKNKDVKGLICNKDANKMCIMPLICNKFKKYRSYDGSCNNLAFPFGVAYRPFRRILESDYADGE